MSGPAEAAVVDAVAAAARDLALLVAAVLVLAPLNVLGWWARRARRQAEFARAVLAAGQQPRVPQPSAYLLFLSGVGAGSETLLPEEVSFLDALEARLPSVHVVRGVFPYAAGGLGAVARRLGRARAAGHGWAFVAVGVRNLGQVLVSADHRYGPLFSYAASRQMALALVRAGYRRAEPRPVFLLGSSGGAQVAVAAAPLLRATLGTPVEVVSLGGVVVAGPRLHDVDHVVHLYGSRDRVQALAPWLFPSGRPHWRRARHEGRVDVRDIGPVGHRGRRGYLGAPAPGIGPSPREFVLTAVDDRVRHRLAALAPPPEPSPPHLTSVAPHGPVRTRKHSRRLE